MWKLPMYGCTDPTPCIEFEDEAHAYAMSNGFSGLDPSIASCYYDNRYWVMWKLPMYGCTDPMQVVGEIKAAVAAMPDCFIRLVGFDNIKQVQCASLLVHRPYNAPNCAVNNRQV